MMKEKNWLTWLTVLALVVGFAAMGDRRKERQAPAEDRQPERAGSE